jgi:uncharacterized membrane protein
LPRKMKNEAVCYICGRPESKAPLVKVSDLRQNIKELIKQEHPGSSDDSYVCLQDLRHFRTKYVQEVLEKEMGEVTGLEKEVLHSMEKQKFVSRNITEDYDQSLTLGQRLADRIAAFGGSWRFIIIFGGLLFLWIAMNSFVLLIRPFDAYPFIFLNLILSCLAAIQAPIIMMSQNRQEDKDRVRSEHDYQVNLKAELEIRNLHEKLDFLLLNQWQKLLEIQQIQTEMIEEILRLTKD